MDDPAPQLQRVQRPRHRHAATRLVWVVVVAAATFLGGLGIGSRLAPAPTPTAFVAAQVSQALLTAYVNRGTEGWGLCALATEIRCQPIAAAPAARFARFEDLPLKVSPQDWIVLAPITVPPGHYVLAGPMPLPVLGPSVSLARVPPDGVGALIGPDGQATLNGAVWADLGSLDPGRYVAVAGAYRLAQSAGSTTVTWTAWGLGLIVSSTP